MLETFEQRRVTVARLAERAESPAGARSAVADVITSLERLSAELAPFGDGVALGTPSERALFRAKREVMAARNELLRSAIGTPPRFR